MARGNGRQNIVCDDVDRDRLLEHLGRAAIRCSWRVYAFAFMSNRLHVVLKTSQANLSRGHAVVSLGLFRAKPNDVNQCGVGDVTRIVARRVRAQLDPALCRKRRDTNFRLKLPRVAIVRINDEPEIPLPEQYGGTDTGLREIGLNAGGGFATVGIAHRRWPGGVTVGDTGFD
jgi:hypothetical protein